MRLALIMVEEDTGRAVQLRDNDTLGPINNESAILGHQRHFTHVHFLFFYIPDDLLATTSFLKNHQP